MCLDLTVHQDQLQRGKYNERGLSDLLSLVQTCVASSFVLVFGAATALLTTPSITCTARFIDGLLKIIGPLPPSSVQSCNSRRRQDSTRDLSQARQRCCRRPSSWRVVGNLQRPVSIIIILIILSFYYLIIFFGSWQAVGNLQRPVNIIIILMPIHQPWLSSV